MNQLKTTIIPIRPSTHTRSTQGDRWLFAVSDQYLAKYDLKKKALTGKIGGNARRKAQLVRYNTYKQEIRQWQASNGFKMPLGYFSIWFYIPVPPSWRKKLAEAAIGQPHMNTPDLDNCLKAFFDGIMPRKNKTKTEKGSDDRRIHCYAAFKRWCRIGEEKIVIKEYDAAEYLECFR